MLHLFAFLSSLAAVAVLIPVAVFSIEIFFSRKTSRSPHSAPHETNCRVAVLMPAHNEAPIIERSVHAMLAQLSPNDRLVVIADNCNDETAVRARDAGATVIVRSDVAKTGKGYALDFGVRYLRSDPPDIVIVVDADCEPQQGALSALTETCLVTGRPTQALYLMRSGVAPNPRQRIAEFAFIVKNQARPSGLKFLGLPCQLMGSGMAFGWDCISTATLATGHITEDIKLGLELAQRGHPPVFCPAALVISQFPETAQGSNTQRTRWEHGHLGIIFSEAPLIILKSIFRGQYQLLALTLDLSIPPLALLCLSTLIIWALGVSSFLLNSSMVAPAIASAALALLGVSVCIAWRRFAAEIVRFSDLGHAAAYAFAKIPMYFRFLSKRQVEWIRSSRDTVQSSPKDNP